MIDNYFSHTKNEIEHQPEMWLKTYKLIESRKEEISSYLKRMVQQDVDVILTGAGSSAFVGESVQGVSLEQKGLISRPVAITDLVTHPAQYLSKTKPTLLVSFARSGNSPESIAAIDIVNKYCKTTYHIIITCNAEGRLYLDYEGEDILKVLLPEETNDKSLAMTSSFTSMMLAYNLVFRVDQIQKEKGRVEQLAKSVESVINSSQKEIERLASLDFKRAVFLGSGPLAGIARECHLKLQELTDGQVICKFDTFLGFRHGPKAVIDEQTLLVYLMSNVDYVKPYEIDLINQINHGSKYLGQVLVSMGSLQIDELTPNLAICFSELEDFPLEYIGIAHVVFGQLLGFYKSLNLGLDPDKPSVSGAISRVVQGVSIYDYQV